MKLKDLKPDLKISIVLVTSGNGAVPYLNRSRIRKIVTVSVRGKTEGNINLK